MRRRLLADALKDFKPGDKIEAAKLNAVLRAVQNTPDVNEGFSDEQTRLSAEKDKAIPSWNVNIVNDSGSAIPPFSIFSIIVGEAHNIPVRAKARKIGQANHGSHMLMLTNGDVNVPDGAKGVARPIGMWEPIQVQVKAGQEPGIGEPCGVFPDTFEVAKNFHGMVCLSVKDDQNRIWVMRTRELVAILGKVTEEISAGDPCAGTLGEGKIKVYVRTGAGPSIDAAGAPSTDSQPWELPVYNYLPTTFKVNTFIQASSAVGIGLIAESLATEISPFVLTGNLSCGGTATAELLNCNGTSTGTNVTVKDTFSYRRAFTGYRGWAVKLSGSCTDACADLWWILEIEHKAHYIEGTALGAPSSGIVSTQVNRYMLGLNPGSTVDTHDPDSFFPRILMGAKIKAILSECDDKYYIVNAQQATFRIKCTAASATCGDSFAPTGNQNLMFSPFNLMPTIPSTIPNPLSHACLAGDTALIEWDHTAEEWFLSEVKHHPVVVLDKLRFKDTCKIQGLRRTIYTEVCEDAPDELDDGNWTDLITMYEHEYITDAQLVSIREGSGSGSTCGLQLEVSTDKICSFKAPSPSSMGQVAHAPFSFSSIQVLVDVYDDGECLKSVHQNVFVACWDDATETKDVICSTECGGSGSG